MKFEKPIPGVLLGRLRHDTRPTPPVTSVVVSFGRAVVVVVVVVVSRQRAVVTVTDVVVVETGGVVVDEESGTSAMVIKGRPLDVPPINCADATTPSTADAAAIVIAARILRRCRCARSMDLQVHSDGECCSRRN